MHPHRCLFALFAIFAVSARAADRKPNILFLMVDEMRWNAMSCAGNPIVHTPHLDQLAREGTRFATAYTVAPICVPSRYSLFTGRYAHVHGATDNGTPTTEPLLLLPTLLKHFGYETAISGKLHFIPNNQAYDFDYFWSFTTEGPHKLPTWPEAVEATYGRGAARRLTQQPFPDDPLGGDLGKLTIPKEGAQTFWLTDRAIEFLDKRDKEKPFFLFVSYLDPHSPSHLCDPYWNMFDPEKMPLPPTFHQNPGHPLRSADNRHEVYDPAIVKAMTAAYYAKVTMVDDNIARLLAELERRGLKDDTLIVFTADHGNMLGDHNRWFKGVTYEGSARVPLLLKAPASSRYAANFNQGKVINEIVENIDVMPTLCEMIGVDLPKEGIQGRSLAPLAAGHAQDWKNVAFSERESRMIRTPQYKLMCDDRLGADPYSLFDLTVDPMEEHDLAKDPAHAAVFKELSGRLAAWQKDHPPVPQIEGVPMQMPTVNPGDDPKQMRRQKKKAQAE
jgi:choline-sulfatase